MSRYLTGCLSEQRNRKESHDKLEKQMRESIARAAAAKVPNVITFSGNRRGQPDAEGRDNCILGLRRIKAYAEEQGVTVCVELLNSKVNHKDYQCDHTAWGVEVCRIVKANQSLKAHTGIQPRFFCYPFGGYDGLAIQELRAAGIVAAFTENDSRFEYASNTMRLPRVRIRGRYTLKDFIVAVTGDR